MTRICTSCKRELPATTEFFHACKRVKRDGLRAMCKKCYTLWREANRSSCVARSNQWRLDNPGRQKELQRAWYERNRDDVLAQSAQWQRDNPEKVAARNTRWRKRNPDKVQAVWARRDAWERFARQVETSLTAEQWKRILVENDYLCTYCGSADNITIDHIVPISKGGRDEATNVAPACGPCNSSKGNRLLSEWTGRREAA